MKPYRVEYVRLANWEAEKTGLWLAENDNWLLLRNAPSDYLIDGYVLVAKAHIVAHGTDQKRRQVTRVLKLKGVTTQIPEGFAFGSVVEMLRWIEQQYKLFQLALIIEVVARAYEVCKRS